MNLVHCEYHAIQASKLNLPINRIDADFFEVAFDGVYTCTFTKTNQKVVIMGNSEMYPYAVNVEVKDGNVIINTNGNVSGCVIKGYRADVIEGIEYEKAFVYSGAIGIVQLIKDNVDTIDNVVSSEHRGNKVDLILEDSLTDGEYTMFGFSIGFHNYLCDIPVTLTGGTITLNQVVECYH